MTLKAGDRVRFKENYNGHRVGTEATVIEDERIIAGYPHVRLRTDDGSEPWPLAKRVEKIKSAPFKLERGDKVVNRKTGRTGFVTGGQVFDTWNAWATEPVDVKVIEEYEEWHPGTYDLIKKDAPW